YVGRDRATNEGRRGRMGARLARAVHGGGGESRAEGDRRRDPGDGSGELHPGERGRGAASDTALKQVRGGLGGRRRFAGVGATSSHLPNPPQPRLTSFYVPCFSFTATESGPSPSATSVIAPANNNPSSSKFPRCGSFNARMTMTISTAMHSAHRRVKIPRMTHAAPTVSMAIKMTAKTTANGNPMSCRNVVVAGTPR